MVRPLSPSPHSAPDRSPPNSRQLSSISANRCISGSSRCSGMFGTSSQSMHPSRNSECVRVFDVLDLISRSIPMIAAAFDDTSGVGAVRPA
jgi:hypothetical protein